MPQAVRLIDAEGLACIYVPVMQNGRVVDCLGRMEDMEDD